MSVKAILVDGIVDALGEIRLQFDCRDWNAVKEEHNVDSVLIVKRIAHLPDDSQAIGRILRHRFLVKSKRGFELRHREPLTHSHHIKTITENIERSTLIDRIAKTRENRLCSLVSMVLCNSLPVSWLRLLNPSDNVIREERERSVVLSGIAVSIEPVVTGKMFANIVFEVYLFVEVHAASFCVEA
jgi:hypothetical protein